MKKWFTAALLGLVVAAGGVAVTPAVAKADSCYSGYHWEYRTVWVQVACTAYDDYGCPYIVYKYVAVRKLVKVYDY